jgi:hypothetical protein
VQFTAAGNTLPTNQQRYVPVTWVTVYTEDMGNTFALKGFWALVMRHVS